METSRNTTELAHRHRNKPQHNGNLHNTAETRCNTIKLAQHSGNQMQYNEISTTQWKQAASQWKQVATQRTLLGHRTEPTPFKILLNPTNPDYGVNCKISLLVFETKPGIFCLCCKTNSYAIEY